MYEKNQVLKYPLTAFFCSILDGENIFKHLLLIAQMLKVCTEKPILVHEYWQYCGIFTPCKNCWATETAIAKYYMLTPIEQRDYATHFYATAR
jgi:hypothetical protein